MDTWGADFLGCWGSLSCAWAICWSGTLKKLLCMQFLAHCHDQSTVKLESRPYKSQCILRWYAGSRGSSSSAEYLEAKCSTHLSPLTWRLDVDTDSTCSSIGISMESWESTMVGTTMPFSLSPCTLSLNVSLWTNSAAWNCSGRASRICDRLVLVGDWLGLWELSSDPDDKQTGLELQKATMVLLGTVQKLSLHPLTSTKKKQKQKRTRDPWVLVLCWYDGLS